MNSKKSKQLRRDAKKITLKEKLPATGYVAEEFTREVPIYGIDENGLLNNNMVRVKKVTLSVHTGTEKGVYKKLKKDAKG